MVREGIRGGMCHVIHKYAKANDKYMKNYDKEEESSYIHYLDANNLYGWAMSQKLSVKDFKWIEDASRVDEDFIKNYDEDGNTSYLLNVDVEYLKELHDLHSDLPLLPERMKTNKCKKPVVHIRVLKQTLKHGLKLKKRFMMQLVFIKKHGF